jgi:hypothetical protein
MVPNLWTRTLRTLRGYSKDSTDLASLGFYCYPYRNKLDVEPDLELQKM